MAILVRPEDGKRFQMGGGESRRLVDPGIGANWITLNYSVFQAGHEFPQHIHDDSVDIFVVLNGSVSVRQGEDYTPIGTGELAYIPPGEVHGTVNHTQSQATLISFQSPPDDVLYQGDRDPSVTGTAPKPPTGHKSSVQIRSLREGPVSIDEGIHAWDPISPRMGAQRMNLSYYELEPHASVLIRAAEQVETVWFVWSGEVNLSADGETLELADHAAVFIPPGESQVMTNSGTHAARLIRCQASPKQSGEPAN